MDTIERLYAPITEHASREQAIGPPNYEDNTVALRPTGVSTSFSWAMHLVSTQRRQALRALYAFCREVDEIADGEASRALKQTLLANWRGEIAHLYGGRPRNAVTLGLSKAVHLYGLQCHDFLAIIDGAGMKAQTDIRAPSLAQLDRYCECMAVAVGRLSVRIFGDETPAGERVAVELGRVLWLTNILRDLAEDTKRHRLYCLANYCTRTAYSRRFRVGYWRRGRFPTCAAISPYSPNAIMPLPLRQLPPAVARPCAQRR